MTNEEISEIKLAEAWVGENGFCSDCNNINSVEANREMINAFLAGHKTGRPEWHDLRKNPEDLPKNKEKVLLKYHFSDDDEIHISDGYYDAYDFEFHIANNPKFRIVCVITWKEIVLP
ncbi:MAG: hypothetical protein IKP60_13880 [Treponema sp.]|nr:hypothetical protein [Treponema sp.]